MELNADFINIQGILIDLEKSLGELKKIRYKSGNEDKCAKILNEFEKILSIKKYIQDGYVNEIFEKELKNFVLFIVLNTEFNTNLENDQYSHLTNITPQLSKCLLCNLIVELDLTRHLCNVLHEFSLDLIEEIVNEMITALDKRNPADYLTNSHLILQLIITKLAQTSPTKEIEEQCEKLYELVRIILLNYTCMQDNQLVNIKKASIYKQMGFNVHNVLLLILQCDPDHPLHVKIIEKLLQTGCTIMMAVTLDVFCCWAEIDVDDQILQKLINENAYLFIEKYTKYEFAKEFINIVRNIAQKPKTLKETIHEADIKTVITMVNKCDNNQKLWFQTLLNKPILNDKQAIRCIDRWVNLCDRDDVTRLLNSTVSSSIKDHEIKRLIIKCASILDANDLIKVCLAHFHRNGVKYVLNDNLQQDLVLLFNKLQNLANEQEFSKDLYLLLLQDPETVFAFIYNQCLKNQFYTSTLGDILKIISDIGRIDDLALNILNNEIRNNQIGEANIRNYTILLNRLIVFKFFTIEKLITIIVLPILRQTSMEPDYKLLKSWLEILAYLDAASIDKQMIGFLNTLFDIMRECRCSFVEFASDKQEIVKLAIDLLNKYENSHTDLSLDDVIVQDDDLYGGYYKRKLFTKTENLLHYLYPDCDLDDHAECVSYLIKVLPRCVNHEWLSICHELSHSNNAEKTVELFTDVLVVLCHFLNSQGSLTKEVQSMLNGLKYCLRNFGFVIQEIQSKTTDMSEKVVISKNVCRLLVDIPYDRIKHEDALCLACILSENSLKSLENDEQFVCYVSNIKEPHIQQILQKK